MGSIILDYLSVRRTKAVNGQAEICMIYVDCARSVSRYGLRAFVRYTAHVSPRFHFSIADEGQQNRKGKSENIK
jgi:hypothetical protein